MNIKNVILGALSIIIAIVVFFVFFWVIVAFVVFGALFLIYARIRSFFIFKKQNRDYVDIEADYEEEDVVVVIAPDGSTENIPLENSTEDKPK